MYKTKSSDSFTVAEKEMVILNAFTKKTGLPRGFFNKEKSIEDVQQNKASNTYRASKAYATFGAYYITVSQDECEFWDSYSRKYHNAFGPKRSVSNRLINFYRDGKKAFEVKVNNFAGHFILNAIISEFRLQKVKVAKELRKVQIIEEADIELIKEVYSTKVFKRSLGGITLDFCAVNENVTFHAKTVSKSIAGLKLKLKTGKIQIAEIVNKHTGFRLGFCTSGMKSFCENNGLDFEASYTKKEIRDVVMQSKDANFDLYGFELYKLGIYSK